VHFIAYNVFGNVYKRGQSNDMTAYRKKMARCNIEMPNNDLQQNCGESCQKNVNKNYGHQQFFI